MRNVGQICRLARDLRGRGRNLAAAIIVASLCATAGAQIDKTETDLHGGERVYGLYAPSTPVPYVNTGAITLRALGATDPNASFYAYGLYTDVDIINNGGLDVRATGGSADASELNAAALAPANMYALYSTGGMITNNAHIDLTAAGGLALGGTAPPEVVPFTGGTSAASLGYGIYSEQGGVDNAGELLVCVTGGDARGLATDSVINVSAEAQAFGIYLDDASSYTIDNSGDLRISASGGQAEGASAQVSAAAWAFGIESFDAPVINNGSLLVEAYGGDALSTSTLASGAAANANAYGYGIESNGGGLNNSGAVSVSAGGGTATAQGTAAASARAETVAVYAEGGEQTAEVRNTAAIGAGATGGSASSPSATATAYATADGLYTYNADTENTGAILVFAQGGNATSGSWARAYGEGTGLTAEEGTLNNSGPIDLWVVGGTAQSEGGTIQAYARAIGITSKSADTINSGPINALAEGSDIAATGAGIVSAYATGIDAEDSDIANSGPILVDAHGGLAKTGDIALARACGIDVRDGDLNNSGAITAMTTADDGFIAEAYGILFSGQGTLTNTGVIRVVGDTAFELAVSDNATLTLIDTYNVTLEGDPDKASIYVGDAATLALNDAKLTVTAAAILWDTQYKLFETSGTGVVIGAFGDVQAVNPNTTAVYDDQGTAGSDDDTVALAYAPVASTTLGSAAVEKQVIFQGGQAINNHMTGALLQNILNPMSSGLLADAGPTAESLALANETHGKATSAFVEPYYSRIDRHADPLGLGANLWGFSAGGERYIENTLLSLHAGYGQADIEYTGRGYSGNSEDQDIVTGGFSALTRWDPWTLRYGLTGFYGRHDYEGLTGLALDERETASFDSYGTVATLMAGRIFQQGRHVFLPEVGLNWLWAFRERYTTEATDPSWATRYSAMNDHDVQAVASLRWLNNFLWHDIRVSPSLSVGVRHLLTAPETNVWQSVDGVAPVLVRSKQDRTAVTLSGSLLLTKTPHAVSFAYDGDYSSDAQRHSFWLRYSWLF